MAQHHAHWEHVYRTVLVHFHSWDLMGITQRDLRLATYINTSYAEYLSQFTGEVGPGTSI